MRSSPDSWSKRYSNRWSRSKNGAHRGGGAASGRSRCFASGTKGSTLACSSGESGKGRGVYRSNGTSPFHVSLHGSLGAGARTLARHLGAADRRILSEFGKDAGCQLDRRLGPHRPVRHQQRARPGIKERLGQAGQAAGIGGTVARRRVAGRQHHLVRLHVKTHTVSAHCISTSEQPLRRKRSERRLVLPTSTDTKKPVLACATTTSRSISAARPAAPCAHASAGSGRPPG